MSNDWFYRLPKEKSESGPISLDDLRALGVTGELPRTALVREGDGAWRVASSMTALWETEADQTTESSPSPADVSPASHEELETPTSLEEFGINVVDESAVAAGDEIPTMESLDDLGFHIVDESEARPAQPQRPASRVLRNDEWNDPNDFRVDRGRTAPIEEDDEFELDEGLRELAESALTGTTPGSNPRSDPGSHVLSTSQVSAMDSKVIAAPVRSKAEKAEKAAPKGEYFLKVDGKPHGPIDFPTLRSWAEEGRIIEADELQLPGADMWIPAGTLSVLFEGLNARSPSGMAAPAATPHAAAPPAVAAPPPMPVSTTPEGVHAAAAAPFPGGATPPPPGFTPPAMSHPAFHTPAAKPKKAKIGRTPSNFGAGIQDFFANLSGGGGGGDTAKKAVPIAIGLAAVVVLYFLWGFLSMFDNDGGTYKSLIAHYQQALEIRKAGGAGWEGFAPGATAEVQTIVEELTKTASAKEPEKQRMLWAARDYLLPILANKSADTESDEDLKFREHMSSARSYLGESMPPVPGYSDEPAPTGASPSGGA